MARADLPGPPMTGLGLPGSCAGSGAGSCAGSSTGSATSAAKRRPMALKSPKAPSASGCHRLEDLPNIGPAMAADLRALGITHPRELAHRDAFVLYQSLCVLSGKRQDPCVLDTFMAATDFMRGAAPAPWWAYTAQRKLLYGAV